MNACTSCGVVFWAGAVADAARHASRIVTLVLIASSGISVRCSTNEVHHGRCHCISLRHKWRLFRSTADSFQYEVKFRSLPISRWRPSPILFPARTKTCRLPGPGYAASEVRVSYATGASIVHRPVLCRLHGVSSCWMLPFDFHACHGGNRADIGLVVHNTPAWVEVQSLAGRRFYALIPAK